MAQGLIRLLLFHTSITLIVCIIYSLLRWFLSSYFPFPWYDLDGYFIFVIPAILSWAVIKALTKTYLIRFDVNFKQVGTFKFWLWGYLSINLILSQFLLDGLWNKFEKVDHAIDVREHVEKRFFEVPPFNLKSKVNKKNILFTSSIQSHRGRVSYVRAQVYAVQEIVNTNQEVWLGKHYSTSFSNKLFGDHAEEMDQFVRKVKRDANKTFSAEGQYYRTASFFTGKRGYLTAINKEYNDLMIHDVTILEVYKAKFYEHGLFVLLSLMVIGLGGAVILGYQLDKNKMVNSL